METMYDLLHLQQPELPSLSFFEIGKIEREENIISNYYCFFLENNNRHGLGTIFIDSLVAVLKRKKISIPDVWKDVHVKREAPAGNRKRIDLLVYDIKGKEQKAIIIESKINASVNNDLDVYWRSQKLPLNNKFGVLLHYKQEPVYHDKFTNITHAEWMQEVRSRINKAKLRHFYAILALQLADTLDIPMENVIKRHKADIFVLKHNKAIRDYQENKKPVSLPLEMMHKADTLVEMYHSMQKQLFVGLKERISLLRLNNAHCNYKVDGLKLRFELPKCVLQLFIFINQDSSSGPISMYLDLLSITEENIKKYQKILATINSFKIPKNITKLGLIKVKPGDDRDEDGNPVSYTPIFRKNYSDSELSKIIDTNNKLFQLIKNDWLPVIELLKKEIDNTTSV